jgi:hypothetical protein
MLYFGEKQHFIKNTSYDWFQQVMDAASADLCWQTPCRVLITV